MVKRCIDVAAGAILSAKRDHALLALRQSNQHQGNLWEFPGGKLERGEGALAALNRELQEEIGISVDEACELIVVEHDYGDKAVRLHVFAVLSFAGEPTGLEGQVLKWVPLVELPVYDFPEANLPIIDALLKRYPCHSENC